MLFKIKFMSTIKLIIAFSILSFYCMAQDITIKPPPRQLNKSVRTINFTPTIKTPQQIQQIQKSEETKPVVQPKAPEEVRIIEEPKAPEEIKPLVEPQRPQEIRTIEEPKKSEEIKPLEEPRKPQEIKAVETLKRPK